MLFAVLIFALQLVTQPTPEPMAAPPSPGDTAFQDGAFDDAGTFYARALTANAKDVDALIGAGTIALYRNHLERAKALLERALVLDPQNATAARELSVVAARTGVPADYRIDHNAEVDVPLIGSNGLPLIHATINGHPVTLLVDTDATDVALDEDLARTVGVESDHGAHIESLRIGTLTIHGVPVDSTPRDDSHDKEKIDGAIGTNLLTHFLTSIDFVRNRLTLRRSSNAASFETVALANGGSVVPMWLTGSRSIFVNVRVNDAPSALFSIDTGDGGAIDVARAELDAADIPLDPFQTDSAHEGGAQVIPFTAQSVTLGSFTQAGVPGLFTMQRDRYGASPFAVAGSLPSLFFHHAVLTLDFTTMQLAVTKE